MNDFDFEELDKAVSELGTKTHSELGGPAPEPVQMNRPALAATPRPAVVPKRDEPAAPMPDSSSEMPSTEPTPSESVVVSTPAKRRLSETRPRSRGAFMDIVPPTSRKPTGRVGAVIQPLGTSGDIVPEKSADGSVLVTPEQQDMPQPLAESPQLAERAEPKPTEPEALSEAKKTATKDDVDWPDPLDFRDEDLKGKASEQKSEPAESASPFLAEAKVEKRPLGAFSNFKPAPEAAPAEPEKASEAARSDELTPDANGVFTEPHEHEKAPLPPKDSKPEHDEESKPDLHNAAMMSIPQQYHTDAKPTDNTHRSIFDTKEYHPPLIEATSHEHRGGGGVWGKIFIAFVVLALVVVGGYFAYVYFVQQ